MEIEFNNDALAAISILESHGFEAYIVGGAIRNAYLGVDVVDYDISTNADVGQIVEMFKDYKSKLYGGKGICVGAKINDTHIEISSFNGNDILDDLGSRDFTVNAMAYNPKTGIIDPYNGINDIKMRVLKPIRSAVEVFEVDPIRILRAIRFEALYGLYPTEDLTNDINRYAVLLNKIHPMRVPKEIEPVLVTIKPSVYIRKYIKVFSTLIPELGKCVGFDQRTPWHHLDVFDHLMQVLDYTYPNLVLRLAALFHDMLKPKAFVMGDDGKGHYPNHWVMGSLYAEEILTKYSFSKLIVKRVTRLVYYHDNRFPDTDTAIINFIAYFGDKDVDIFFDLQKADIYGQNPNLIDRLALYDRMKIHALSILGSRKILTYKKMAIKQEEIIEQGFSKEDADKILNDILWAILDDKIKNTREDVFEYFNSNYVNTK